MKLNDIYTEEKVRLDPKCWTGKKIGNPKTKVKGGVRVNNCVPAESVEEDIDRRGFLKGMGAAAVAGAAGGANADRSWQQDELTKQWQGQMTSETFAGAVIHWNEERQVASLALTEPTNFSINNVKQNRLYFPKFTSTSFTIKIGDSKSFNGTGSLYTFPLRQLGDYKGNGMTLLSGKNFTAVRDEFVNADKVLVRVEIDGHPTTMTFHDNPGHIQQRQTQRKQPILDKISQEEDAGSKVPGFHGIYSAIQMRGMLEQYKDVPSIAKPYDELTHEIKLLAALTRGHKISQDIENWTQQDSQLSKARPTDTTTLMNWYTEVYSKVMSRLKKYNAMLSGGANESVEQGVAEEYNPEYDDEAGMADNNLETLRRTVDGLDDIIDAGDNLPEWCQEKIAVAKSMLVAVWDYMESEDDTEEDPEIAEMYEAMESLAEEMAHRNRVSVDRVWESFEALDDHMLYETAAWRRKEGKSKSGGLNAKGVASYRRENPGSKLQTAVTTKPSKLKKGSKAAKRRKSFCARMSGVKGPMKKPNGKPTRKALALRKWNC